MPSASDPSTWDTPSNDIEQDVPREKEEAVNASSASTGTDSITLREARHNSNTKSVPAIFDTAPQHRPVPEHKPMERPEPVKLEPKPKAVAEPLAENDEDNAALDSTPIQPYAPSDVLVAVSMNSPTSPVEPPRPAETAKRVQDWRSKTDPYQQLAEEERRKRGAGTSTGNVLVYDEHSQPTGTSPAPMMVSLQHETPKNQLNFSAFHPQPPQSGARSYLPPSSQAMQRERDSFYQQAAGPTPREAGVSYALLEKGAFHGNLLLGDDPIRQRQQQLQETAHGMGLRLLPAPLEVEALERELERVRLHLQIVLKDKQDSVDTATKAVRSELEAELKELREQYEQAQREWASSRADLHEQIAKYRRELSVAKQDLASTESIRRELHAIQTSSKELSRFHEAQLVERDEAHTTALEEEVHRRQTAESRNERLVKAVKALEEQVHKLLAERDEEDARVRETETYKLQSAENSSLRDEISQLKKRQVQLETMNKALERQVAAGHRAVAEAERRRQDVETKTAQHYEEHIAEQNDVMNKLQQNLKKTQQQLQRVLEENRQLTSLVEKLRIGNRSGSSAPMSTR